MEKPLRSLAGLTDFECAARWSSFKLAAHELHKTPAAVSQQIKQLEGALGFALFTRHPRHIALTEKGQDLAVSLTRMLGDLQTKVQALRGGDEQNILRISTTQSMAIKWLAPRIGGFTRLYPELDIHIDSNDKVVDLDDGSIDVALRYGVVDAADPGLLIIERLVAVYSPSLLAPGQSALTLADLKDHPLLIGETSESWIRLFRENGVLNEKYHFSRSVTNAAVGVQWTIAGQGVGLVAYGVAHQDILNGNLKMIACRSVPSKKGYRFLVGARKEGLPKIERFRSWLIGEFEEMKRVIDSETGTHTG